MRAFLENRAQNLQVTGYASDFSVRRKGDANYVEEEKGVVRREYQSMRYERSFNVHGVDRDNVSAKMENGILYVTLPKSPERLGRKIDVS